MNRLHGLVKLYHGSIQANQSQPQQNRQQTSNHQTDRARSRCSSATTHQDTMEPSTISKSVVLSYATTLIFLCLLTLSQSQQTPKVSKPLPFGAVLKPRGLEALAPYTSPNRPPFSTSSVAPNPPNSQQLTAESSNIVHKFKFAFHNRPNARLIEEEDDDLERPPTSANLVRGSRHYEPTNPFTTGRVARYLPGSSSSIYVDSSDELIDDFEPRSQPRRDLAREKYTVTDSEHGKGVSLSSAPVDRKNGFYKLNSNNNTIQNIVIPLPTHRLNDRSLATGVIVISQDNGFPGFRDSASGDVGRHYHYELLSLPPKGSKPENQMITKVVTEKPVVETSAENRTDDKSEETPEIPASEEEEIDSEPVGSELERMAGGGGNEKREVEPAFVPENDQRTRKEKLAALTISLEDKRTDVPSAQSKPSDFVASSLKARIHLSRPSANSFNINLVKTTELGNETIAEVTEGPESNRTTIKLGGPRGSKAKEGTPAPSLLLLVERETMLSKMRKNGKKLRKVADSEPTTTSKPTDMTTTTTEEPPVQPKITRPRRRHHHPRPASISVNANVAKDNFVLKPQRKNDRAMRLNVTISETPTGGNTTEKPSLNEFSTTSILNSLVKELNMALKDRIRQLESLDQTTTTTTPATNETTLAESTTTTAAPESTTTTTEANNISVEDSSTTESSDVSTTTTMPSTTASSDEEVSTTESTTTEASTTTDASTTEVTTTDSTEDSSEDISLETTSTVAPTDSSDEVTSSEETSDEVTSVATTTTTQATTTTTTPAPTTTTTTTTAAPVTKANAKRESRRKAKQPTTQVTSISISKKSKKSSKLTTQPAQPKPVPAKQTLKTSITVKNSESKDFKLAMNVTLPHKNAKLGEPLKRSKFSIPASTTTTTTTTTRTTTPKPLPAINKKQSLQLKKNKSEITSTPATIKWSDDKAKLLWSIWNPSSSSTSSKAATNTAGRVMVPLEEIVLFDQRRPPGPPKIPNNFGFANTIRGSQLFDEEEEEIVDEEVDAASREIGKRLTSGESSKATTDSSAKSKKLEKEDQQQPKKKVERERDFEDDNDDGEGDDEEDDLADTNVPGTPGVDYPVLGHIPDTSFDCAKQQYPGFYSDMEVGCQVYHSCSLASIAAPLLEASDQLSSASEASEDITAGEYGQFTVAESSPAIRRIQSSRKSGLNGGKHSFLCPNGTIFSQEYLICDWWYNVKCEESPRFYPLNRDVFTSGQQQQQSSSSNNHHQTVAAPSQLVVDTVFPGEYRTTTHYHDRISPLSSSRDVRENLYRSQSSPYYGQYSTKK